MDERFLNLLEVLGLTGFWDLDKQIYQAESVLRFLRTGSRGEVIMLRFCLCVWLRNNHFEFDFIEAASTLDDKNMAIVTGWMSNPFWP